jgi:hypothetical protein
VNKEEVRWQEAEQKAVIARAVELYRANPFPLRGKTGGIPQARLPDLIYQAQEVLPVDRRKEPGASFVGAPWRTELAIKLRTAWRSKGKSEQEAVIEAETAPAPKEPAAASGTGMEIQVVGVPILNYTREALANLDVGELLALLVEKLRARAVEPILALSEQIERVEAMLRGIEARFAHTGTTEGILRDLMGRREERLRLPVVALMGGFMPDQQAAIKERIGGLADLRFVRNDTKQPANLPEKFDFVVVEKHVAHMHTTNLPPMSQKRVAFVNGTSGAIAAVKEFLGRSGAAVNQ